MRRIAPARGATFTQPLPKWPGAPLRARPAWSFELRNRWLHHNRSLPGRFLRSAQSMAEMRKKDRRNGLQRSFCHRRFPVPAGNRSKRALSLAVLLMGQAVSQTAPHSGRCSASAYPACWAPASTARFPVAGGSACTWPEKALGHLVHEIAV